MELNGLEKNKEFCKTNYDRVTSVKAICDDGTETIYPSIYRCSKVICINPGIIKMVIDGVNSCNGGISKIDNKYYTFQRITTAKHENKFNKNDYNKMRVEKLKGSTILCECGRHISILSKSLHLKSKIHQKNMNTINCE
jgi:hypothetical protein